jgi:hypothetical protein
MAITRAIFISSGLDHSARRTAELQGDSPCLSNSYCVHMDLLESWHDMSIGPLPPTMAMLREMENVAKPSLVVWDQRNFLAREGSSRQSGASAAD